MHTFHEAPKIALRIAAIVSEKITPEYWSIAANRRRPAASRRVSMLAFPSS